MIAGIIIYFLIALAMFVFVGIATKDASPMLAVAVVFWPILVVVGMFACLLEVIEEI